MRTAYSLIFLANAGMTLSALFIPLLADELGLSFFELGIVGMAYGVASFFSYSIFGRLSDMKRRRRVFVRVGFAVAFVAFILQLLMGDLFTMVVVRGFAGFAVGIFTFPLLAYASRFSHYRERIGWFAGFGSLGWFAGYLLAGVLSSSQLGFTVAGALFFLGLLVSFGLGEVRERKVRMKSFWKVARRNLVVYSAYFLRHVGAYSLWIIFPLFLRDELGATIFWVGAVHALNTGSQFLLMGAIGRMAKRGEGKRLLRVGLGLSALVFFSYYFAISYVQLLPVQLILGLAWSALYVGSLLHLLEHNVERATSTGLLGSTISLAAVVGPLLGGVVSQIFGMRAVALLASGLALGGLAMSKWVK